MIAALAYLLLAVLLITAWRGRLMGLFALLAVVSTLCWVLVGLAVSLGWAVPSLAISSAELAHNAGWFIFLTVILTDEADQAGRRVWNWVTGLVLLVAGALTLLVPWLVTSFALDARLLGWILQAVFGLLLVEQVFRNRLPARRWGIKHLCLGLGAVFAYDLFFYSDGLLMRQLSEPVWEARGLVNALIVPLIAVSAARNPSWSVELHVSRHVVFHSATLSGAGLYLMAMAAAGYYIRLFGGAWSAVLQIAFLFSAAMLLVLLLFSGQWRSRLRILVSEHFFSFKYDYREEWLKFTEALSVGSRRLPEAVVRALGEIIDSPGGLLWVRNDTGGFELLERINHPEPSVSMIGEDDSMVRGLLNSSWIIDLDEWRRDPTVYQDLEIPDWLSGSPTAWLVVPLINRGVLCGFVVLLHSRTKRAFNWEDRALLKTAGRQAASSIAQYLSDQALMHARQFEAFNQLAAYVAHDLKNLLAQQALILSNAERHRHNPAFMDDVLSTIKSSVERMGRLMEQLRNGVRGGEAVRVDLLEVLHESITRHSDRPPLPRLETDIDGAAAVMGDRERLRTIFGHLIQNACEATGPDGSVVIRVRREERIHRVEIQDDGVGMTAEFIRDRLFRPFDSTKGLTGMGIGAFEAREMVRLLGGDLTVESQPGVGSLFRIRLPAADPQAAGAQSLSAQAPEVAWSTTPP
nr:XrtA/PEP-CTERM system histidine kinase PrsK [Allochromatium palmeri]